MSPLARLTARERVFSLIAVLAVIGAALILAMPSVRAQAYQQVLMYGQSAGTVKVLATDTNGKIVIGAANDPCMDPNTAKSSAVINVGSATTTSLVAISGTTTVYVCGFSVTATGTAPSFQFEYGTGATCGTGTAVLTGTYLPTAGTFASVNGDETLFKTIAAQGLCLLSAGTGPSIQGVVTYVQQ